MSNLREVRVNVPNCALAFEGGGYRDAFSAGVANVLLAADLNFGYVCGVSAGASNTVDYTSRDQRRVREAFMTDNAARQAVGLRSLAHGTGWFNADMLYEGAVQTGTLPFDWDAFCANPADTCIQAFRVSDGASVRFHKADMGDTIRLMDMVRASSTLPGAMQPRPIDGEVYYDGGLGVGAGLPVCLAQDDGYQRVFFIATREKGYRKARPSGAELRVYRRLAGERDHLYEALATRWERYNTELDRIEAAAEKGDVLVVYPDAMTVSSGTTNSAQLRALYEAGRRQAVREMDGWLEWLYGSAAAAPELPAGWDGYVTIG